MPRVGSAPSDQTSGGSNFDFQEGRGKIVAAKAANHEIPGYTTDCGFVLTIQRLDANWKPTNDEPTDEFIKFGSVEKFHPGRAASSDDDNPELEIGGKLDLGSDADAEGTCVLAVNAGPDKKAKISIFTNSCIAHGVKDGLFNGYAPNLVGLEAHFSRLMLEKIPGSTSKRDPTVLIVGKGGKVEGAETKELIHKYPDAQTGASGAKKGPTPVATAGKPKVNGAAAVEATSETATSTASDSASEAAETKAAEVMAAINDTSAGQTLTRQKIGARLIPILAKDRTPSAVSKAVQELFKKDEWFLENATAFGWEVSGANITIPAAG